MDGGGPALQQSLHAALATYGQAAVQAALAELLAVRPVQRAEEDGYPQIIANYCAAYEGLGSWENLGNV